MTSRGVGYLEDIKCDRMSYIERIEKYIITYLDRTDRAIFCAMGVIRDRRIFHDTARLHRL